MSEPTTIRQRPEDRERLEAVVADRNSPQKHVWRARIILLLADGLGPRAVQRRTGKSQPTIRRWRERFLAEGVAGLRRDKTRPPGAALDGYLEARGERRAAPPPTREELEELMARFPD